MSEHNKRPHARKQPRMGRPGGGGPMGMMKGEKAKDFKGTVRKLLQTMKPYTVQLVFVVILAMASTVFSIFGPRVLGRATTEIFTGLMAKLAGTGGIDFPGIARILLTMLALYLMSLGFGATQGMIMTSVAAKVTYNLRADIAEKINRLPLAFFDSTSQGEVLSRMTNDIDNIAQNLNQSVTQIIMSVTQLVGVLIMMLTVSPTLSLVALLSLPLSMLLVTSIVKRSQPLFVAQQEYLGHLNGHIEEMYGGQLVIKAYNRQDVSVEKFNKYNKTLYNTAWKSQFYSTLMMPLMRFMSNLSYVVTCIMGGWLVTRGAIALGDIVTFTQYINNFMQPVMQIANISNVLQATAAAAERVFEFLGEEEESPDPAKPVEATLEQVEGAVTFERVHFGYDPEKPVIQDFSLDVKPGEIVAIVGPTGGGKTTLVKLLMRYYELQGGAIRIDGHDITEFSRNGLRDNFGMVLQDTWLFTGTIRENIRYGRLDATDDEVKQAAKAAQADAFIRTLPGGYDFVLNEEISNISQGEKQLITIARAILSQPRLLILDEATSSVDTRTEMSIQTAMAHLMEGRTCFVIAHRLSTIREAGNILVIKDGAIVETGNHKALMAKNGFYAELYQSQFEGAC